MKRSQILALVVLLSSLLFVGCCSCRKAAKESAKAAEAKPFVTTAWTLSQIGTKSTAAMLPEGENMPRIIFAEDGSFGGYAGCNSMGGEYQVADRVEDEKSGTISANLTILNPFTTKRMCPNDEMERDFLAALATVDSYVQEGAKLMLFSNGVLQLVFEAK